MTVFLSRGTEAYRWDLAARFGRPPNLAPPRWAFVESLWRFLDASTSEGDRASRGTSASPRKGLPESPELDTWRDIALDGILTAVRERAAQGQLDRTNSKAPADAPSLCLVIPDHTRTGSWRGLLPSLAEHLVDSGSFSSLTLLIATGTHRSLDDRDPDPDPDPDADADADACGGQGVDGATVFIQLGEKARPHWKVIQNSEEEFRTHRSVGQTSTGTEVYLHPAYLDSDVRVLFGETSYHYFAGFGGGPKLIFPGVAEPRGAQQNHSRALDPGGKSWEAGCRAGEIAKNPVHQDIREAASLAPPDWVVTLASVPGGDADPSTPNCPPVRIIQGRSLESFYDATERHDRAHRVEFTQRPEILIIDAGGAPRDDTFLQAHKSLQAARRFAKTGGRVLLVARCCEGWGSSDLAEHARREGGRPSSSPDSRTGLHKQTRIALSAATDEFSVALWSELPAGEVEALGMTSLSTEEEALRWVAGARSWGWLPRAEQFRPEDGWLGGGEV